MATSPNGVSGEMTDIDLVDIIDKNAPTITVTQKLENNQMNVIFRSDETVFVSGGGLNRKYGGTPERKSVKAEKQSKKTVYMISHLRMQPEI